MSQSEVVAINGYMFGNKSKECHTQCNTMDCLLVIKRVALPITSELLHERVFQLTVYFLSVSQFRE